MPVYDLMEHMTIDKNDDPTIRENKKKSEIKFNVMNKRDIAAGNKTSFMYATQN